MASINLKVIKVGDTYQIEGRPREEVKILKVYNPSNIPGKSVLVISIDMDPNAATPSHTHGGAAALAIVVDGTVLNQMNCEEPIVSKKGDFWYEAPGCHHVRSENVSGSETAKFLAILIVDDEVIKDGFHNIFVLDAENQEQ
ncbi:hypothetical protein BGW36DRAFT_345417 [Talaromyces proteolyticus]|uniref:Cupin type-2 domain-containing protein n=1 Tax=Talaromyces proteolyticus TaxID=1131652 RepID=A0AAD4KMF7_9EURO|nr:uncharacterized protein BGW36DRAFT_345417 [Talaromyces proteolyticus]KAH8693680.1 hypothetical protein BGW36DRAFT_345417 [Talaromyces proteolyticus]